MDLSKPQHVVSKNKLKKIYHVQKANQKKHQAHGSALETKQPNADVVSLGGYIRDKEMDEYAREVSTPDAALASVELWIVVVGGDLDNG